jgi:3-methyladenine DNA glycosylase AlkD
LDAFVRTDKASPALAFVAMSLLISLRSTRPSKGNAMNFAEVMQQLESLGSEATRTTWCRHGAAAPLFGVKFGDLGKLQKRIKVDQVLASQLWSSGNHDARLLACMIADASAISEKELLAWAAEVRDSGTAEALAALASKTPKAEKIRDAYLSDAKLLRAGWSMVAHGAKDASHLTEASALNYLKRIEAEIHTAENWTRRTMMYALLGIGSLTVSLRTAAESAIKRIGKVSFDPGKTACEFPDAAPYLAKIWARKKTGK